jgi:hypothetical protein
VTAADPGLVFGTPVTVANGSGLAVSNVTIATCTGPGTGYMATIFWGDGTPPDTTMMITQVGTSITVKGTHTYYTAGKFSIAVAVKDATGQVSVAPLASTSSSNATIGNQNERWVSRAFMDTLGRQANVNEINQRVGQLTGTPPLSRSDIASILDHSAEYRQNLVKGFYMRYLRGRVASNTEITGWVNQLSSGTKAEEVQKGIMSSTEYYGNYGNSDAATLVAFYWDVMGRKVDPSGYNSFLGKMSDPMIGRSGVLNSLLYSTEYRQRLARDYYWKYLRRAAGSSEVDSRVNQLAGGAYDEDIITSIVGSPEYLGLV